MNNWQRLCRSLPDWQGIDFLENDKSIKAFSGGYCYEGVGVFCTLGEVAVADMLIEAGVRFRAHVAMVFRGPSRFEPPRLSKRLQRQQAWAVSFACNPVRPVCDLTARMAVALESPWLDMGSHRVRLRPYGRVADLDDFIHQGIVRITLRESNFSLLLRCTGVSCPSRQRLRRPKQKPCKPIGHGSHYRSGMQSHVRQGRKYLVEPDFVFSQPCLFRMPSGENVVIHGIECKGDTRPLNGDSQIKRLEILKAVHGINILVLLQPEITDYYANGGLPLVSINW